MAPPRKNPPQGAIPKIEELASQGFSMVGIGKHFGVSSTTFKRWCDDYEEIQQAFETGRETERQALHSLIVRDALAGKPANANAMFLLKCRHHYRENDSPSTKVDVNVNQPQPVMIVVDHGTDEEWAIKVREQQRRLTEPESLPVASQSAPQALPGPVSHPIATGHPVPVRVRSLPVPAWHGKP